MALVTKCIVVDEKDWKRLPEHERSAIMRKMVKQYLASMDEKADHYDVEILNMEIVHLKNELIKVSTQLESKEATLSRIHEKMENEEKDKLEKQKQAIEDAKKCINCKRVLEEGNMRHEFSKGLVCNGCYMGAGKDKIAEWMKRG